MTDSTPPTTTHETVNLFSVPRVGVAVFIVRKINGEDCVLVGKRKGSHGRRFARLNNHDQ